MDIEALEWLRDRRGHEQVTFDVIADHLEDFARRRPEAAKTIGELAAFLARDEDVDREHDDHGPTPGG